MPTPAAQAAALQAYGLSEQLWGLQPTRIDAREFIAMIAASFDECMQQEREHTCKKLLRQIEATLPRELMITVDVHGVYAIAERD